MENLKFDYLKKCLATFAFLSFVIFSANAQRSNGAVGIGAQIGQPTGLTVKIYKPAGVSTDILAAWDLGDFFFLNVHGLWERHLGNSERVHWFAGPGAFIGVRNHGKETPNDLSLGISGTVGLNVILGFIELYGQVTPRLELIEATKAEIGGGVGIRFYF